ncbi:5676_t:CDS:1, partial [Racocetra persica]
MDIDLTTSESSSENSEITLLDTSIDQPISEDENSEMIPAVS